LKKLKENKNQAFEIRKEETFNPKGRILNKKNFNPELNATPLINKAEFEKDASPVITEDGVVIEQGDSEDQESEHSDIDQDELLVDEFNNDALENLLPTHFQDLSPEEASPHTSTEETPHYPVSGSKDIIKYDPLEAYLREISVYKPLTKEEEKSVALKYYESKDIAAAYKLVTSNLWLVVKIARDYKKAAKSLLDLIQEGNIGLLEAVKNFDPYREVRFPSYAIWWVKAFIIRYLIANLRLVKIGTTQAQRKLFFNLNKEKDRLEKEGFYPGPKLIASNLNVRESDVIEMEQRLASADMSFDAPLTDDSDSNLMSIIPSGDLSAEEIVEKQQIQDLIRESLEAFAETLNEKERVIFQERLLGEEKLTLNDLADQFSLSRERIRQIEVRVKEKLKKFLISKLGSNLENII
jgi:RNA polymerase sigma-32 factor